MSGDGQNKRSVAIATLFCALALCCAVMYLTADSESHEAVLEEVEDTNPALKVTSMDVLKAGEIFTETPRGTRDRLMDYFKFVEGEIATEVSERKSDIASVRATMAKDFAFNSASRAKLKKDMMAKMAENAKIARDDLDREMRKTQAHFAMQAAVANRRYAMSKKRDQASEKLIKQNKRRAAKQLKLATSSWQKATNAWAASTNAHIDKLNAHASANAAAIKENAKKARKDLENAMGAWDHKVATFRSESSQARSKLSAQFKAQDKATRAWANNKIKGLVAQTAAQFNDVETKMAKNRHEVDMAVKHATTKFKASLDAAKALENKRFAENQANIEAMKAETKAKVDAASAGFKVSLLALGSEVKKQVSAVNNRIDKAASVVRSDAAAQAKVNANINAEMSRMVKLGNKRYEARLKNDAELQGLIAKDKEATDKQMNDMAADFNSKLSGVRKQLKHDREHAESQLKKATAGVYAKLAENEKAQAEKNAAMAAATARMRLDQMDAIREAKEAFRKKIHDLGQVVAENDKKADGQIKKLTGIVTEDAAKSATGRQALADMEKANKNELTGSIQDAIAQGEKRALEVEEKGEKMDAETKKKMENRLNAEITKLRDETNQSVEALSLQNKAAREQMKKEMLYAIRAAADSAKQDLMDAVKESQKRMVEYQKKSDDMKEADKAARDALTTEVAANAASVSRMLNDAVAADAKAQIAFEQETAKKIDKTNTQADAYAQQMKENAKKARDAIKSQETVMLQKISQFQGDIQKEVEEGATADTARQAATLDFLKKELTAAGTRSKAKFGDAMAQLAQDRADADNKLSAAVSGVNAALTKQAALSDERFKRTVKNIAAAKKQAADDVAHLRKEFASELLLTTSLAKNTESKITGLIEKVSGEVISLKAHQERVNRRVKAEKKRIEKLANERFSESKRARGKLRQVMDQNKAAAAAEVDALTTELEEKIDKARATNAHNKRQMAKDLTKATEKFYGKLALQAKADQEATDSLNANTEAAKAKAAAALKKAQETFDSKIVLLTDTVTANAERAARKISRLTGVVTDYTQAAAEDRGLIKDNVKTLQEDLNKALDKAISLGEAKAKAVQARITKHLKSTEKFLQTELGESVENAADSVLKAMQGKRGTIADNYLSLKAYSVGAADLVTDYVAKGKGKGLSSIGDLLVTVGGLSDLRAPEKAGLGMGGDELTTVFSGEKLKVSDSLSVVNGLVDEFTEAAGQVRNRWPMGLGKYLLDKVEASMLGKGVLQVDKLEGQSGSWVFLNAHSCGLSNQLSDFAKLAVRMPAYETALAKLSAKISIPEAGAKPAATKGTAAKPYEVPAEEFGQEGWQGSR